MDLQIRSSKPEDFEKILELQASSLRNLSLSYNSSQIESLVRSQASARLATYEIGFVGESRGEIVGFAALLVDLPQISGVYVHPHFIRQGIGTQLLKTVEKTAIDRGHETIYVISSLATNNFYQANGYQLVRKSGFYSETKTWIPCVNLEKQLILVRAIPRSYQRFLSLISGLSRVSFSLLFIGLAVLGVALLPLLISLIVSLFR